MTDSKKLLFDKEARCGGFYELCIQVCPSLDNNPINLYTDFLWTQLNVEGPFEETSNGYTSSKLEYENGINNGVIKIDKYSIPFLTYNVREENPIETGFNWFDICFYEETLNKTFEVENVFTEENTKFKNIIDTYLTTLTRDLFRLYPFQLAMIDFEISGQYYLDNLINGDLNNWTNTNYFIGKQSLMAIKEEYKNLVTLVD